MTQTVKVSRTVYDFKKADWQLLRDCIAEEPWMDMERHSVHKAVDEFTHRLRGMVDAAIPMRQITERKGTHPWITESVLELVHQRNAAVGTPAEADAIRKCSEGMLEARRAYECRIRRELSESKTGSKAWWKISRALMNRAATAAAIPALRATDTSEWCLSAKTKADLFADTFQSKCKLHEKVAADPVVPEADCAEQE